MNVLRSATPIQWGKKFDVRSANFSNLRKKLNDCPLTMTINYFSRKL